MSSNVWSKEDKITAKRFSNIEIILNENSPKTVLLYSIENPQNIIIFYKSELINIFSYKSRKHNFYKKLMIRDIEVNIGQDWLIFIQKHKIFHIYFDTHKQIADYLKLTEKENYNE